MITAVMRTIDEDFAERRGGLPLRGATGPVGVEVVGRDSVLSNELPHGGEVSASSA
jgi:hypothetical protein